MDLFMKWGPIKYEVFPIRFAMISRFYDDDTMLNPPCREKF